MMPAAANPETQGTRQSVREVIYIKNQFVAQTGSWKFANRQGIPALSYLLVRTEYHGIQYMDVRSYTVPTR